MYSLRNLIIYVYFEFVKKNLMIDGEWCDIKIENIYKGYKLGIISFK